MNQQQRMIPAKRAFSGLAGSALSIASNPAPQKKPKASANEVLVHFCFNQEAGESKASRCNCKLRVSRNRAYELIDARQADFLLVRNPKTEKRTKFHRAVVIRQTTVGGEKVYAIAPAIKLIRRDAKHEGIKSEIRLNARGILHLLFSKKAISPVEMQMSDADIEAMFEDAPRLNAFLAKISGQRRLQKKWLETALHWWANILGYRRLNVNAGAFLVDADRGAGEVVSGEYGSAKIDRVDGAGATEDGRVTVANHRPSFWNGAWDYSIGASPKIDQDEEDYAAEYDGAVSDPRRSGGN